MASIIIKSIVVVVVAVLVALLHERRYLYTTPAPNIPLKWWGVGKEGESDTSIKPFKINISKEVITDLQQRLKMTRPFNPPLEGIGFQYGFNTKYLNTIVDFWLNKYSWTDRQVYLNSYPQYTTEVAGLKIHFIHLKPATIKPGIKVIPLLLVHGWPGSLVEFYKILPLLTTPRQCADFVFEVIAPAIPGYGFSQATTKPGMSMSQVAVIFGKLMEQLKFDKYFVQGGDWGSAITTIMSLIYPDRVRGLHLNMCMVDFNANVMARIFFGSFFPSLIAEKHEEKFLYPFGKNVFLYMLEESGYMHLQASKPDTVGVALRESPIGLAAYILEKFSTWTDRDYRKLPDGGLPNYDMTELLDNVMYYWVTGSITTSMRLYSESLSEEERALNLDNVPINVPSACARFPNEILLMPTSLLKLKFKNLVQVTDMKDGGHFAAFQLPKELSDDIWAAVKLMLKQENKPKQ